MFYKKVDEGNLVRYVYNKMTLRIYFMMSGVGFLLLVAFVLLQALFYGNLVRLLSWVFLVIIVAWIWLTVVAFLPFAYQKNAKVLGKKTATTGWYLGIFRSGPTEITVEKYLGL